jgi:glycosyltransferase involved in cell wall biosynthesis
MSTINIVVPALKRHVFSGGILCIFQYSKGLTALGHEVNIVPLVPSPEPQWVKGAYGRLVRARKRGERRGGMKSWIRETTADLGTMMVRLLPHEVQRGYQLRYARGIMPPADITIATSFETALPVHLYGQGKRFYFLQHFESYFAIDMTDPLWAEYETLASYGLGLRMIANSSWLRRTIAQRTGIEPELCTNAIDHDVFNGEPRFRRFDGEVRVISYGGAGATWKGMADMAQAVRLVRAELSGMRIRWQVFGTSKLPPNNDIASYEPLGFLQPAELAKAYRQADILLSASWYESFPLFPLEGMACGLPVITTPLGTEDFALHEQTAEIVQPRDPGSIANGLLRVIRDETYREHLAVNAPKTARQFSWPKSVGRMHEILFG